MRFMSVGKGGVIKILDSMSQDRWEGLLSSIAWLLLGVAAITIAFSLISETLVIGEYFNSELIELIFWILIRVDVLITILFITIRILLLKQDWKSYNSIKDFYNK